MNWALMFCDQRNSLCLCFDPWPQDDVEDAAGFSKVIDLISSTGKPVVGHNIMLDVMHVLHQFSCQLPEVTTIFQFS